MLVSQPVCEAFNLDVENPAVYSGPHGSYFGYAVDFYLAESASASVVIGAPKANTRQVDVTEGGSVFYCPWSLSQSDCHSIEFDAEGDRNALLNDTKHQVDFKSHQWFGATVRSHGDTILACAPLYSWRTEKDIPRSDATGTCYLSVHNFTKFVEYAPCRTVGQGYCQGGFSADFTTDGKVGIPIIHIWSSKCLSLNEFGWFPFVVCRMVDLLVGAPMFMMRGSGGRLEEMGRVYVYLQQGPLNLELSEPHLTGTQVFGRFGSTIAPLGDLNQDGFNDVAISAPFGGDDHQGLVYIFNGYSGGLREKPSQVIAGQWAAGTIPASFGFSLRGAQDLDMNGYPDLIVGAFGVDKAILYRYVILTFNTSASLTVSPGMINPEEKNCMIVNGNTSVPVSCCRFGIYLTLLRDHKKKGAVKRALFLDSQQPSLHKSVRVRHGERVCDHKKIYLRDEKDFKDKLSPIYVAFNYSLDPKAAADSHGLRPILNYQTTNVIEQKAQILLDCGEDNICVPDLKLAVVGDRKEVYLGDDNSLTLTFNARNEGEGGAYEAELYVVLPPEADYIGIARNNESRTQLTCSYDTENQTRYLSCELGNPMKSGTSLMEGLRFTVPRVKDTHKTIQFDLQIRSKNENNSHSEIVSYKLEVVVQAEVILQGVSRPDKVFFPPANWQVTKNYGTEQDIGPGVEHIYELVNNGPSRISHTLLTLHCPLNVQSNHLLYPVEFSTVGPINCTSDHKINSLSLKVSHTCTTAHLSGSNKSCSNVECWKLQCTVGLLERGTTAILKVRSRVWAETFIERAYKQYVLECLARYSVEKMPYAILPKHYPSGHKKVLTPVVWNKPDIENSVPLWIIILAVLVGLLLLALLIYILYKFGFFKRSVPYGTAMEKAQLKPQAASEA
uniref:Integrin, alpha 5 (fibronectin receptor, alpha polypeptide) n=1 Tax=Sphaeramia orbicularis TaxID=375764 RepID=A0A673CRQ0_9TELE